MSAELTFNAFGLHAGILQALEEANFKTPSSIQQEVILVYPLFISFRKILEPRCW